ncbi:MAG TPA: cupin domain-containing protein [Candidatus Acidoferrum sp.]|nr:cupin domain-containing protein [Candidatus Acidoferrum sp.]
MGRDRLRPYALKAGAGWTYNYGIDFTIKVGERGQGRRVALIEYTTRSGEEPPDHTHDTEDEIFYVLEGELRFRCGDEAFDVKDGGVVFLPSGIEHGYQIRSDGDVRLLVVTAPVDATATGGWGGFIGDIETQGERQSEV